VYFKITIKPGTIINISDNKKINFMNFLIVNADEIKVRFFKSRGHGWFGINFIIIIYFKFYWNIRCEVQLFMRVIIQSTIKLMIC
jgi:hypothetical protein